MRRTTIWTIALCIVIVLCLWFTAVYDLELRDLVSYAFARTPVYLLNLVARPLLFVSSSALAGLMVFRGMRVPSPRGTLTLALVCIVLAYGLLISLAYPFGPLAFLNFTTELVNSVANLLLITSGVCLAALVPPRTQ